MKRTSHEQALARLQEQQRKLQERANKIHARVRKQERVADARRKILAGAFLLKWMERDPEMRRKSLMGLDRYLSRDIDRQHFELELRGDDTIRAVEPTTEEVEQKKAS